MTLHQRRLSGRLTHKSRFPPREGNLNPQFRSCRLALCLPSRSVLTPPSRLTRWKAGCWKVAHRACFRSLRERSRCMFPQLERLGLKVGKVWNGCGCKGFLPSIFYDRNAAVIFQVWCLRVFQQQGGGRVSRAWRWFITRLGPNWLDGLLETPGEMKNSCTQSHKAKNRRLQDLPSIDQRWAKFISKMKVAVRNGTVFLNNWKASIVCRPMH